MKPQCIKYVIMAEDMPRAVAFYRDVLGFDEGQMSPYWSELRSGDAIVGLHSGGDGSRRSTGLSVQYEDVEAVFRHAVDSRAAPIQEPSRREGEPIILCSIADPEGNEIMLTQYGGD